MVERVANQPTLELLPLTPREQQVFKFVNIRHNRIRQRELVPQVLIAKRLGLKRRTVNQFVTKIEEKGYSLPVARRKKPRELTEKNNERLQAQTRRKSLVENVLSLRLKRLTITQIYLELRDKYPDSSINVIDGILHVLRTQERIPRVKTLMSEEDVRTTKEKIKELRAPRFSDREISKKLGKSYGTIKYLISLMLADGEIESRRGHHRTRRSLF